MVARDALRGSLFSGMMVSPANHRRLQIVLRLQPSNS